MSIHLEHVSPRRWSRRVEHGLAQIMDALRQIFVVLMIVYTLICIISFAVKLFTLTATHGVLDFKAINEVLTDGLYVLIILAIVKSLFLRNSFDYVVTLAGDRIRRSDPETDFTANRSWRVADVGGAWPDFIHFFRIDSRDSLSETALAAAGYAAEAGSGKAVGRFARSGRGEPMND
ncbi:hypothetical protein [Halothiobacillus sp.]|uniref:hypothetical protein n=1 Tax=Halothiobacillus sp. TaxID=1891311 RepID=UPI002AD3CFFA|nr:hypothetical protein [Halothiobacillus sp.]